MRYNQDGYCMVRHMQAQSVLESTYSDETVRYFIRTVNKCPTYTYNSLLVTLLLALLIALIE